MALLGVIVEHVSGTPFAEYTLQQIFEPLEMDRTAWYLDNIPGSVPIAMAYYADSVAYGHCTFADFPNGGLRTSGDDYAIFMSAIASGESYDNAQILMEARWTGCCKYRMVRFIRMTGKV